MKRLRILFAAISFFCLSIAEASSFSRPLLPNTVTLTSGESCGTDEYTAGILAKHPELALRRDLMQARILPQRENLRLSTSGAKTAAEVRTIPVVFHIIHANGPENLSDEAIQQALDTLNASFRNQNGNSIDTGYQFALARTDPNGQCTDGINRIYNAEATYNFSDGYKPLSNWDNTRYYNVWVAAQLYSSGIAGYATFPWTESPGSVTDGVAIKVSSLNTTTFIHETGHWLGLYHTFENACNDASGGSDPALNPINSSNCASTGDLICDTAPQTKFATCPAPSSNTCVNDAPDQPDDGTNFMGYTDCRNHFTPEQGISMDATTSDPGTVDDPGAYYIRAVLWSSDNLKFTGVSPASTCSALPVADFYTNPTQITVGTTVVFHDLSYRQQNQAVTRWSWTFEGGNPSSSTLQNPTVSYASTGLYTVKLVINGEVSTAEKADYLRVLSESEDLVSLIFSGNSAHSLFAISASGRGFGWGNNGYGLLGIGGSAAVNAVQTSPKEVLMPVLQAISSGSKHSLFVSPTGQVYASGSNYYGALGIEGVDSTATPLAIPSLAGVTIQQVLATKDSSYALDSQGRVWAWGSNSYYQLGDGTQTKHTTPFLMPGLPKISKLTGNSDTLIALDTTGQLWIAGYDDLNFSGSNFAKTATAINDISTVRDVVTGTNGFFVAEKIDHSYWCWGRNTSAECGLGFANSADGTARVQITEITALRGKTSVQLSAGAGTAYLVDNTGSLWAWGSNQYGQVGIANNYQNVLSPTQVADSVDMVAAASQSVAVMKQGQVCLAGNNSAYEYGNGTNTPTYGSAFDCTVDAALRVQLSPEVYLSAPVQQINAGMYFSTLLTQDGRLWAWGRNDQGQLGLGIAGGGVNNPAAITALKGIQAVAAGTDSTLALRFDGTVWGWGDNASGQLGNGSIQPSLTPVQAINLKNIIALAAKDDTPVALDATGVVWHWGSSGYDSSSYLTTPSQVVLSAKIVAIGSGRVFRAALDNQGQVWAWGYNGYGQLGNNSTNLYNDTPQVVSGLAGKKVLEIALGKWHALALTDTGEVFAWGNNDYGQLGDGSNTDRYSPVKVASVTGVAHIYAGYQHSLALTTDGSLYAWGLNNQGQFGDNSINDSNVPVLVSINSTDVKTMLDGGFAHSLLLKRNSDGLVNLCATGSNYHGQLGNASYVYAYRYACDTSVLLNDQIQAVDNPAPEVALTTPTDNTIYAAGAGITLWATASDSDGIARVEFYANGNFLGMATTPPYSYTWAKVNAGNYTLTAKAVDWRGNVANSTAANVTVKSKTSTTTTLSSNSGYGNTSVVGQVVTFTASVKSADASLPTGVVYFYLNGNALVCESTLGGTNNIVGVDSKGMAKCTTHNLPLGAWAISANYDGDNVHVKSNGSLSQTVIQGTPTITRLSLKPKLAVVNQPIIASVSVTSTAGLVVGVVTVSINNGSQEACSITLVSGSGACTLPGLPSTGIYTITAHYGGSGYGSGFAVSDAVPAKLMVK